MIIDRYFNSKKNTYLVSARIIEYLLKENEVDIDDLFINIERVYPNTYDNYIFESLGLLYLTDKIYFNKQNNTIGLKKWDY